jgi:hypothetical protein
MNIVLGVSVPASGIAGAPPIVAVLLSDFLKVLPRLIEGLTSISRAQHGLLRFSVTKSRYSILVSSCPWNRGLNSSDVERWLELNYLCQGGLA